MLQTSSSPGHPNTLRHIHNFFSKSLSLAQPLCFPSVGLRLPFLPPCPSHHPCLFPVYLYLISSCKSLFLHLQFTVTLEALSTCTFDMSLHSFVFTESSYHLSSLCLSHLDCLLFGLFSVPFLLLSPLPRELALTPEGVLCVIKAPQIPLSLCLPFFL